MVYGPHRGGPYYALPVMCSVMMLATVELGGDSGTPMQPGMKMAFRGLSVALVPMTCMMPQAVFMYWVTSNVFSTAQLLTLKQPAVRTAFGLPLVTADAMPAAAPAATQAKADDSKVKASAAQPVPSAKSRRRRRARRRR